MEELLQKVMQHWGCKKAEAINRLKASGTGAEILTKIGMANGLYGGAAYTYGLATLGMGTGMVGGIIVLSVSPAGLGVQSLYTLAYASENDKASANIGLAGGIAGFIGGGYGAISAISAYGSVTGLSME